MQRHKRIYGGKNMKPWTRLPDETPKAYEAFECYRDMGPSRSIQKVGERLAKHPKALARLSKKYDWVRRANLFDAYVGERKAEETATAIIEMHKRHALHAQVFQEIALEPVKELRERIQNGVYPVFDDTFYEMKTVKLADLTPRYFRMFKEAADMERIARDMEEKMSAPAPTAEEINCSESDPESSKADAELVVEKIDEVVESQQDLRSQADVDKGAEKPNPSEEVPSRRKSFQKRSIFM
jgi:hypothetical protein